MDKQDSTTQAEHSSQTDAQHDTSGSLLLGVSKTTVSTSHDQEQHQGGKRNAVSSNEPDRITQTLQNDLHTYSTGLQEHRYAQNRSASQILKRNVEAMGLLIHGDTMCRGRKKLVSHFPHASSLYLKHRQDATLAGHIEHLPVRIEGQHIGCLSYCCDFEPPHAVLHIDHEQDTVAITGDEGKACSLIEEQAVVMLTPWQRILRHESHRGWIDGNELTQRLHRDEDTLRDGVILRVACLTAKGNRGDPLISLRVDHGVGLTRLIRNKEMVQSRVIGQAIGVDPSGNSREHMERLLINDRHLIGIGC